MAADVCGIVLLRPVHRIGHHDCLHRPYATAIWKPATHQHGNPRSSTQQQTPDVTTSLGMWRVQTQIGGPGCLALTAERVGPKCAAVCMHHCVLQPAPVEWLSVCTQNFGRPATYRGCSCATLRTETVPSCCPTSKWVWLCRTRSDDRAVMPLDDPAKELTQQTHGICPSPPCV